MHGRARVIVAYGIHVRSHDESAADREQYPRSKKIVFSSASQLEFELRLQHVKFHDIWSCRSQTYDVRFGNASDA